METFDLLKETGIKLDASCDFLILVSFYVHWCFRWLFLVRILIISLFPPAIEYLSVSFVISHLFNKRYLKHSNKPKVKNQKDNSIIILSKMSVF